MYNATVMDKVFVVLHHCTTVSSLTIDSLQIYYYFKTVIILKVKTTK